MKTEDKTLINLLELDGVRFIVDEHLGLWVKFEAKRTEPTKERPYGVRYSLTLHDRDNQRIMGFDNSHVVEYGGKTNVKPKQTYDHWHRDSTDKGRPYQYVNATKLLEDFWNAVDRILERLQEVKR